MSKEDIVPAVAEPSTDGSIGDPSTGFSSYRAPWTFQVVGETEAAIATCAWIRRNLVTPDGRIDGPYRVFDEWSTYRDATLIVGAHLALAQHAGVDHRLHQAVVARAVEQARAAEPVQARVAGVRPMRCVLDEVQHQADHGAVHVLPWRAGFTLVDECVVGVAQQGVTHLVGADRRD